MLPLSKTSVKNIILIVQKRLGDAMFCLPTCQLLKKAFPFASLDVLAQTPVSTEVFAYNPLIRYCHLASPKKTLPTLKHNYDLAIDFQYVTKSRKHLLSFQCPHLIFKRNFSTPMPLAENMLRYFSHVLDEDASSIKRSYDLYPQTEHKNRIDDKLYRETKLDPNALLIGFHLGCHSIHKKRRLFGPSTLHHQKAWPLERFISLARQLQSRLSPVRFVLTGTSNEISLGKLFIEQLPNTINCIGETSVLDLAELTSKMSVYVTNDTGALHVACSTSTKLIALFGETDPVVTGPYPAASFRRVIHQPTLDTISEEIVLKTLLELLHD